MHVMYLLDQATQEENRENVCETAVVIIIIIKFINYNQCSFLNDIYRILKLHSVLKVSVDTLLEFGIVLRVEEGR